MSFLCAECADAREKKHTQDNNNMEAYTKREGEEKRSRVVVKEIKIKKMWKQKKKKRKGGHCVYGLFVVAFGAF